MKSVALAVLAVLLCTVTCLAVRPQIWTIVDEIVLENTLHSSCVGRGCAVTDQWKRYRQLAKEATDEELVDLADYTNPIVRCYAFMALVERKHSEVYPILLRHLSDREIIEVQSGCTGHYREVRELMVATATNGGYIESRQRIYKLTPAQKKTVDSLMLVPH